MTEFQILMARVRASERQNRGSYFLTLRYRGQPGSFEFREHGSTAVRVHRLVLAQTQKFSIFHVDSNLLNR